MTRSTSEIDNSSGSPPTTKPFPFNILSRASSVKDTSKPERSASASNVVPDDTGSAKSPRHSRQSSMRTLSVSTNGSGKEQLPDGYREKVVVSGVAGKVTITRMIVDEEEFFKDLNENNPWFIWVPRVLRGCETVFGCVASVEAYLFFNQWQQGRYHQYNSDNYLLISCLAALVAATFLISEYVIPINEITRSRHTKFRIRMVVIGIDIAIASLWIWNVSISSDWNSQCHKDGDSLQSAGMETFNCTDLVVALLSGIICVFLFFAQAGFSVFISCMKAKRYLGSDGELAKRNDKQEDPIRTPNKSHLTKKNSASSMSHVGVMSGVRSSVTSGRSALTTTVRNGSVKSFFSGDMV